MPAKMAAKLDSPMFHVGLATTNSPSCILAGISCRLGQKSPENPHLRSLVWLQELQEVLISPLLREVKLLAHEYRCCILPRRGGLCQDQLQLLILHMQKKRLLPTSGCALPHIYAGNCCVAFQSSLAAVLQA